MEDPRPDRHVETAEFAPTRVARGRRARWSPVIVLGWVTVVGAVVGLGILGQGSSPGGPGTIAHGAPTVTPAVNRR